MISTGVVGLGIGLFLGLLIGAYGTLYIMEREGVFDAKSNLRFKR